MKNNKYMSKRFIIKNLLLSVLLLGVKSTAFAAADFDPHPPVDPQYHYYYKVTASVMPEGSGWVSVWSNNGGQDPNGKGYEAGTVLSMHTSPNNGYKFSHWEKDGEFYIDQMNFNYTLGEEKPNFVAVYEFDPQEPNDPQDTYQPKKRLYLTCNQDQCSFNRTSGEKTVIGSTVQIQAYPSSGYVVTGWYIGDSLINANYAFNYVMPDHDVILRVEVEYRPSMPGDPTSSGGNIALHSDNLDDVNPMYYNSLFYFDKTEKTYDGTPFELSYVSDYNPTVTTTGDFASSAGVYSTQVDVWIKNDSIDTRKVFLFSYTINKAPLSIFALDATKVYGEANPEFTYTSFGYVNDEDKSVLTQPVKFTTMADEKSVPGTYGIKIDGAAASNYELHYVGATLTITKAPLTVTANDVTTTYGTDLSTLTYGYTLDGFVNGDTDECVTTKPEVSAPENASDAGTYDITVTGGESANYDFVYKSGTLTIEKSQLSMTICDTTKVYGTANPKFRYTVADAAGNDMSSELTADPTWTCEATEASGVGEYAVSAEATSKNYNINVTDGKLTVTKAPLTVSPKNVSVEYGYDLSAYQFEFNYVGFVNDDTEDCLTAKPTVTVPADAVEVGNYEITASGAEAANYEISYQPGTLSIGLISLTLTVADATRVYGAADPEFTFTLTDSEGNDMSSVLTVAPAFTTTATVTSGVGDYTITATGAQAENYAITVVDGTLTVTKAPLTITPVDVTINYGVDLKTVKLEFTYEGFVNGDDESVLTKKPVLVIPGSLSSTGEYDLEITGAEADNYEISYGVGKLTIDKSVLFLAVKSVSREYGDENPQFEYAVVDAAGNNMKSVITVEPSFSCEATAESGIGDYEIVASGAEADNYSITFVNGILTVTPATLTVTADDIEYKEGTAEFTFTYTIDGFKNGEDESVLTKKPVLSCRANAQSAVGKYVITVSGAEAANYVFEYVDGLLNIVSTDVIGIEMKGTYPVYDLLGRKVGTTTDDLKPGLYIINNRKVYIE